MVVYVCISVLQVYLYIIVLSHIYYCSGGESSTACMESEGFPVRTKTTTVVLLTVISR